MSVFLRDAALVSGLYSPPFSAFPSCSMWPLRTLEGVITLARKESERQLLALLKTLAVSRPCKEPTSCMILPLLISILLQ